MLVYLAVTTFIDELADGLQIRISIGNKRIDDGKHLSSSFSETDENAIVDLKKAKQLQYLTRLRGDFIDTTIVLAFSRRLFPEQERPTP